MMGYKRDYKIYCILMGVLSLVFMDYMLLAPPIKRIFDILGGIGFIMTIFWISEVNKEEGYGRT